MRGAAGNLNGLHRSSRDDTPCWAVPKRPKAAHSPISMTRTTTPMGSIILFQLRYLLALKTVIKAKRPQKRRLDCEYRIKPPDSFKRKTELMERTENY